MVSRQMKWQDKMKEQGRCRICGKKAYKGQSRCKLHREKHRKYNEGYALGKKA